MGENILDAAIEVGECIVTQTCLVAVLVVLASLLTVKFGLIYKVLRVVAGFFIGVCMGAYLISLVSYDAARIGAILFGIIGAIVAIIIGKQ